MKGRRILVIEDNPADVIVIRQALLRIEPGLRINVVEDGQHALNYLSGKAPYTDRETHPIPDLILLDLSLPKASGFEVLEWVRTEPVLKQTPIVILATSSFSEDIHRAYEFGANSFITKPTSLDKLVRDLDEVLKAWLKPLFLFTPPAQPAQVPPGEPDKSAAA